MYGSAKKAYETGATATTSNREIEATALFKAARQLEACRETWGQPGHEERLEQALRYNQRLWTLFQAELARPDHPMVPALRRDLLQISVFVDKRTFEILGNPSPERLQALIDIDRNIASGLAVRTAA